MHRYIALAYRVKSIKCLAIQKLDIFNSKEIYILRILKLTFIVKRTANTKTLITLSRSKVHAFFI